MKESTAIPTNQKVRILFAIHDLGYGGAEKVLVNLVNSLDPNKYEITLMSLFGGGIYEKSISPHVRLKVIFENSIPGNSHWMKFLSPRTWHNLIVKDLYDIEIAYLEGPVSRVISGCPNTQTRLISWIHSQQKKQSKAISSFRSAQEAKNCYSAFHRIACVSDNVREDFQALFPEVNSLEVVHNIQDSEDIINRSKESFHDPFEEKTGFRLIGIGKLVKSKGFDKLICVHKRLIDEGINVQTIVLGEGPYRTALERLIKENRIQDSFYLAGFQKNPYPFLRSADLYICASDAEGYSTATAEALILQIPAVSTPVAGAAELLSSCSSHAISSGFSVQELYDVVCYFLKDRKQYQILKNNVINESWKFSKEALLKENERFLASALNDL